MPNGTLFQDMSGSAVTQALALAALQHSGAGATATGSQAAPNLAAATQKEIEMAKLACWCRELGPVMRPADTRVSGRRGGLVVAAERSLQAAGEWAL